MKIIELFLRKTTHLKLTSVSIVLLVFIVLLSLFCSCQNSEFADTGLVFDKNDNVAIDTLSGEAQQDTEGQYVEVEESAVYAFDFEGIRISSTKVLDIDIKNCNLYLDMYGDLVLLGEILNTSSQSKTDVEITINFIKPDGDLLETHTVDALVNYLQPGKRMPFYLIYDDREKYMDISEIEIGLNYNNYNRDFVGLPVVAGENFYYEDDAIIINGSIQNIGQSDVEDLKLFCTFYDLKDRVVFLKEGYLKNREIGIFDKQDFEIKVLFDEYSQSFTHYRLGVFFRDSFKIVLRNLLDI